jgi:hypothetical protein
MYAKLSSFSSLHYRGVGHHHHQILSSYAKLPSADLRYARSRLDKYFIIYRATPQKPFPPQTPNHSRGWPGVTVAPWGDQLRFEIS